MVVFDIRIDDLTGEKMQALLALHLRGMHENSPPDQVFALDLSGLKLPTSRVVVVDGAHWRHGALKTRRWNRRSEVHAHDPNHLRRGVGRRFWSTSSAKRAAANCGGSVSRPGAGRI